MTGEMFKHFVMSLFLLLSVALWTELTAGSPVGQNSWESWESYFRKEETFAENVHKQNLNDGCLPKCEMDGILHPDQTSCNHFFVCTSGIEAQYLINPGVENHSKLLSSKKVSVADVESVSSDDTNYSLLRCSCLDKKEVYNRYLQRCSKRGHCIVSCTAQGYVFGNWTPINYNGYECAIASLPQTVSAKRDDALDAINKAYRKEEPVVFTDEHQVTSIKSEQSESAGHVTSSSVLHIHASFPTSVQTTTIPLLSEFLSVSQLPSTLPGILHTTENSLGNDDVLPGIISSESIHLPITLSATIITPNTLPGTIISSFSSLETIGTHITSHQGIIADHTSDINEDISASKTLKPAPVPIPTSIHDSTSLPTGILKPAVKPATNDISILPQTSQIPPKQSPAVLPATIQKPVILPDTILQPISLPTSIHLPANLPSIIQKPTILPAIIPTPLLTQTSQKPATLKPTVLPGSSQELEIMPVSSQTVSTIIKPTVLPAIITKPSNLPQIEEKPMIMPSSLPQVQEKPDIIPGTLPQTIDKPGSLSENVQKPTEETNSVPGPIILPANNLKPAIKPSSSFESGISLTPSEIPNTSLILISAMDKQSATLYPTITIQASVLPDTVLKPSTLPALIHTSTLSADSSQTDMQHISIQTPILLPGSIGTTQTDYIQISLTSNQEVATLPAILQTSGMVTETTQNPILLPETIVKPTPVTINEIAQTSEVTTPTGNPVEISPMAANSSTTTTQSPLPILTELKPYTCRPIKCRVANTRFPNPKDCTRYYKCILHQGHLVAKPYICPSVMPTFSPSLMMCLRGIKCQPPCSDAEVSTSPSVIPLTTPGQNVQGMLPPSPPTDTITFLPNLPSLDNNSVLTTNTIFAVTESIFNGTQASNVVFTSSTTNTSNQFLDQNITVTAAVYEISTNEPCDLKCSAPNMKVADPTDCHYYYLCMIGENLNPRPIRVRCPSGRPVFDADNGECTSDAVCLIKCYKEPEVDSSTSNTLLISSTVNNIITTPYDSVNDSSFNDDSVFFEVEDFRNLTLDHSSNNSTISTTANDFASKISDCSPICLVPDSWLPDPTDCHYFYVCHFLNDILSKPRRIGCPPNRPVFSRKEGRCLVDGPCEVRCNNTNTISPATTELADSTNCKPVCHVPYSTIPDPTDCYHYYICIYVNSLVLETLRARCPSSKPIFDAISKACVKYAECVKPCSQATHLATSTQSSIYETISSVNNCQVNCKKPDTLISDPTNCNFYYICIMNDNGILEAIRMRCPKDYNVFDKTTGSCMPNAKCEETCSNTNSLGNGTIDNITVSTTTSTLIPIVTTEISDINKITTINQHVSNEELTGSSTTTTLPSSELYPSRPDLCQPNCKTHNSVVHDPLDCHQYFVCMLVKGESYATSVACPPEKPIFHLETYSCQNNVPCIRTCEGFIITLPSYQSLATKTPQISTTSEQAIAEAGSLNPSDFTTINLDHLTYNETTNTNNLLPIDIFSPSVNTEGGTNTTLLHTITDIPTSTVSYASETTAVMENSTPPILCTPKCTTQGTLIPDYTDCNRYYICILLDGLRVQPIPGKCPPLTPIFDADKKQCLSEGTCYTPCFNQTLNNNEDKQNISALSTNSSESSACLPLCREPNTVIPDPKDCRYYYFCSLLKEKLSPNHIRCPENKPIFDQDILVCRKDIPCNVLCPSSSPDVISTAQTQIIQAQSHQACPHAGYFANKNECAPYYDHCYHQGEKIIRMRKVCPKGLVFNPVSSYPYCVPPSDCPYDPLKNGLTANSTSCRHPGRFPKCKNCCSDYILCVPFPLRNGYIPVQSRCTGGLVFNTDPTYPVCIQKEDCPTGGKHGHECDNPGNHPACTECCREYFHCTHDGLLQKRSCPYPLVFNTVPTYPYCVLAWNCPYILP
ncbi:hypothetical protein SK128_013841 [Halocaridina rubra]|uniref:Chitin-binding type-2 domain-containing protein n=1 Tax=Halocaridina rubra TaxID=373956 RepID=A0AAN8WRF6_HALRR